MENNNCKQIRKLMVVSPFFAPLNSIASIRMTKLVKYLDRLGGYEFTVVRLNRDETNIEDDILVKDIQGVCSKLSIIDVEYPIDWMQRIGNIIRKILLLKNRNNDCKSDNNNENNQIKPSKNRLQSFLFKAMQEVNYIHLSRGFCKNALKKVDENHIDNFDVIITTYGPLGSLLLGLEIKKKNPSTKWIMDFRDPIIEKRVWTSFYRKYMGIQACKRADVITLVTEGCKVFPQFKEKYRIICNGYDPEDLDKIKESIIRSANEKFTISYCGTIYEGKRNVGAIFSIIAKLLYNERINHNNIRFVYAGNDYNLVLKEAKKYNVEDIVENRGYITRRESLQLQLSSDVLCLLSWNNREETGVLTGKALEYLMMERPILVYVSGNAKHSLLKQFIDSTHSGFCFEEMGNELDMAEKWLYDRYLEYLETGKTICNQDKLEIQKYSHYKMAKSFDSIINECLEV